MSVKTEHSLTGEFYFCTFTCTDWLSLFEITRSYDAVYKWFNIIIGKQFKICCFVIMPNHVHFIVFTPDKKFSLNKLVSNGKRFLAYEIVKRLRQLKQDDLLALLSSRVTESDRKRGKLHQVFKPSFDARVLSDEKMIWQKMDYIHANPVSKKWNLAKDYVSYKYSSARYYMLGNCSEFEITHLNEILHGRT